MHYSTTNKPIKYKKPKKKIFLRILQRFKIIKYGYAIKRGLPFEIRMGSDKSVWLLTSLCLIKLFPKIEFLFKKDLVNFTTPEILNIYNRINPRCWEIIQYCINQRKDSEREKFFFPDIKIEKYEIANRYFDYLIFYEIEKKIVVEFNTNDFGGFGHLLMEIFPILVYLSKKLPLILSTRNLNSQEIIFRSFASAYGITVIEKKDIHNCAHLRSKNVISNYGLKVASADSMYEYPNYNNICLMMSLSSKYSSKKSKYNKYIYIRRTDETSSGRQLKNEDELIKSLLKIGFEIVYPENYSFQEQISIFSNAKIVIGVHGSALLNSIFCKKNSCVIELIPDLDFRPGIWLSTVMSGKNYHFFVGPSSGSLIELKPEKFTIDVEPLLRKISGILNLEEERN